MIIQSRCVNEGFVKVFEGLLQVSLCTKEVKEWVVRPREGEREVAIK